MSTTKTSDLDELSLAELIKQLDDIVAWFDNSDIDVEQATTKFDQGVKLAEAIKRKLSTTENKVNQIKLKLDQATSTDE